MALACSSAVSLEWASSALSFFIICATSRRSACISPSWPWPVTVTPVKRNPALSSPPSSSSPSSTFFAPQGRPTSAVYASQVRMGNRAKVMMASSMVTMSGVQYECTISTQMYARMEKVAVTRNTGSSEMRRTSPSGMDMVHTAVMASRLKAADPTMVEGPSSPGACVSHLARPCTVSRTARRISGADEPSAISVRLATVAFQYWTSMWVTSPVFRSFFSIFFTRLVIVSIADMNTSLTIATPKKQ
mmetsp:Transcript_28934/g.92430  ORF Transcript_28934/g.92430 Transcript_28934/m.92430 type:complete len:246 (+) Transcript_28934:787-1524(+)